MEIATFLLPIATGKCSLRLFDSCWALPKGYRKAAEKCPKVVVASGQFLKGIGISLGNAQIPASTSEREGGAAQRLSAKM
jgi:hypothetical protein